MKGTINIPAVTVIIRDGPKMLFVLRAHTGWKDGYYCTPGGHVDPGESFILAACREVQEEVGLIVKPEDMRFVFLEHRRDTQTDREGVDGRVGVMFEAKRWTGTPTNKEPDQHERIEWIDPDHLPDNVIPTLAANIKLYEAGKDYVEYGWLVPIPN